MASFINATYRVKGMACTGCEGIIEETLLELEGVETVKADFSKNVVTITFDPEKIGFKDFDAKLSNSSYTLFKNDTEIQTKNNDHKKKPMSPMAFIGIVVVLIAVYLIINSTVGFNFIPEVKSSMGYGVLFLVGLLTSLHCVAMCGGINMTQCINSGTGTDAKAKVKPSLLYNLGRVTSYTIIGGIVGAIGSVISFSGWARGFVAILSGTFMIIMGLSMTGLFPWINKITPRLPRVFREKTGKVGKGKGPYIVGLLNGLMPCGPLQAMQLYALGTGSLVAGALSMFFFSLGTVPLMFGLGAIVTVLGSKFTKKMIAVSAVLVAVLGVVMVGRGLALSGVPLPSFGTTSVSTGSQTDAIVTIKDGVQSITSTLSPGGYPTITVQKGIPVEWNIKADADNINGCNKTLIIPKYDVQITFKPGDNIIKFTPTESGTIQYSCWMGMITGQIKVVDDLGGKTAQSASDESTANAPVQSSGGSCCAGGSFSGNNTGSSGGLSGGLSAGGCCGGGSIPQ